MSLKVQTVIDFIYELAPPEMAMEGDPIGLQIGDPRQEVEGIMIALDMDDNVLQEAKADGDNFVITHHPLIYHPLENINLNTPNGKLTANILADGVTVFSAHTNLDIAPRGVNNALADLFGLREKQVLQVTGEDELEKIAVFIPRGYETELRDALALVGAGWIGNYSNCSFQALGEGTFLPLEGTNPFLGHRGELETVEEIKLETIYPRRLRPKIIDQVIKTHPYEEPAYDLYSLNNKGREYGLGIVGEIFAAAPLKKVAPFFNSRLGSHGYRLAGDLDKEIKKVAVCGGSGGSLIKRAIATGADLLVTGDVGYHQVQEAVASGLAVMDAGHDVSERPVLPCLKDWLQGRLQAEGINIKVSTASETVPWGIIAE